MEHVKGDIVLPGKGRVCGKCSVAKRDQMVAKIDDMCARCLRERCKLLEYIREDAKEEMSWLRNRLPLAEQELIKEDVAFTTNDGLTALNMGDTFAPACADEEVIPPEEADNVLRIYKRFKRHGLVAWAAMRRKQEPIKRIRDDDGYQSALLEITIASYQDSNKLDE